MSQTPGAIGISSFAQETMCYIGQHLVFRDAEELINNLTGAGVNAKQIERVCHQYGQWIENQDNAVIQNQVYKEYAPEKANELHYVSVDGAMYLTREESWKESKLGRIYQPKDIVQLSPKRTELTASTYVTHLGDYKEFITKMNYNLENLNSLVFIADGARWIWKWVEQYYPESTQKDEKQRCKWIDRFSQMMLTKGIDPIIAALEKLPEQRKTTNKDRMQYHQYLEKGLLIGSGAIESAHKDVLQQRLKLSGQRWTKEGFQQMAQLRVVYKSKQGNRIKQLCQNVA